MDAAAHATLPLLIPSDEWAHIEAGVAQRMQLLQTVLHDIYGQGRLQPQGFLPAALVQGHPGYLRPMHGVNPIAHTHLHCASFDLARDGDGAWWLVAQHMQPQLDLADVLVPRVPRPVTSHEGHHLIDPIPALRRWRDALNDAMRQCAGDGATQGVILSHGFGDGLSDGLAALSQTLGWPLIESTDLTVRQGRVLLKTLDGPQPVTGVLSLLPEADLDPLELSADTALGVPGLLQAMRAGQVLVANAPGVGFLESHALLGFWPALAEHLWGQPLLLPALATWWCGEPSALADALPHLSQRIIKPTRSGPEHFDSIRASALPALERLHWRERILRTPDAVTLQTELPLSRLPVQGMGDENSHGVILRVFALSDGPGRWQIVPGGVARLMGSSAGVARGPMAMPAPEARVPAWVWAPVADGAAPATPPSDVVPVMTATSRLGEGLFWVGRSAQRLLQALAGNASHSLITTQAVALHRAAQGLRGNWSHDQWLALERLLMSLEPATWPAPMVAVDHAQAQHDLQQWLDQLNASPLPPACLRLLDIGRLLERADHLASQLGGQWQGMPVEDDAAIALNDALTQLHAALQSLAPHAHLAPISSWLQALPLLPSTASAPERTAHAQALQTGLRRVADSLRQRYFVHSADMGHSVEST